MLGFCDFIYYYLILVSVVAFEHILFPTVRLLG